MSIKWTGIKSDSGILRKSEFKEKKEELFVFGYSCKLFRDDERALHIDQGKHLIPWMGDETLKIDRYDARGALHDLATHEAPPGGYDWRVELTKTEQEVEQLCDEERYRALHTDEDEEEMYKEEELKRLHAAGYGQVGFNYDTPSEPAELAVPAEVDEPFVPTASFIALLPVGTVLPESQKQNAIIEKTSKFIASHGAQMEILIKAKQGDNPQFQFLNKDSVLNPYYVALTALVKAEKWPEKKVVVVEEKHHEPEEYLHPSLASTVIESAPSIPSIQYRPSADCDYALLISRMRGSEGEGEGPRAPGEEPPPGTEPPRHHIARAPLMYHAAAPPVPAAAPVLVATPRARAPSPSPAPRASTALSLMRNYNTDSDTDDSDDDTNWSGGKYDIPIPPEEVHIIIDKITTYVARNGDDFVNIVRAKNDPRFTFLDPDDIYHAYYKRLMQRKKGLDANGKDISYQNSVPVSFSIKKLKEPDPILPKPALPYESSSDDDDPDQHADKPVDKTPERQADKPMEKPTEKMFVKPTETQVDKPPEKQEKPPEKAVDKTPSQPTEKQPHNNEKLTELPQKQVELKPISMTPQIGLLPPVIVYRMEGQLTKDLPTVTAETIQPSVVKLPSFIKTNEIKEAPKIEKPSKIEEKVEKVLPATDRKEERTRERDGSDRREKRKHRERKKDYRSKSESRESRRSERRSIEKERERRKEREREAREKRRRKVLKEDLDEIISLEDNSDDLIDLTGDQSDSKVEEVEADVGKQVERRRRAAEFLRRVGVDVPAALPATSLASAMVDTLELIRKKKAEEEEKKRRREKRRRRDRREYEDDSHHKSKRRKYRSSDDYESDYDGTKKKKRKKDKKQTTKSKKKRRRENEDVIEEPLPNIDITNTLKELRTASPTKDLGLLETNTQRVNIKAESTSDSEGEGGSEGKKKKEKREYSEGEWSSDSEQDSISSGSKITV